LSEGWGRLGKVHPGGKFQYFSDEPFMEGFFFRDKTGGFQGLSYKAWYAI
jgi:hypothetical protein